MNNRSQFPWHKLKKPGDAFFIPGRRVKSLYTTARNRGIAIKTREAAVNGEVGTLVIRIEGEPK